jgi:hypothetical protein
MATVAPTTATWTWPPDVKELAAEWGVTAYLEPVYEMTRRIYGNAPVTVLVDEDPEIANDRRILMEANVTAWDVPRMVDAQNQWCDEIYNCCPSTHVGFFRLGLAASE